MFKIKTFCDKIKIPYLLSPLYINYDGELFLENKSITLEQFNEISFLEIPNVEILLIVSFQRLNLPPIYWKKIKPLRMVEGKSSAENLLFGFDEPIESLEYPGFNIIPYFSNYLITEDGILIKKSNGAEIKASKTELGYYTFRMTGDDNSTGNRLRHRMLSLAFHKYPSNVDNLDVNHLNGIPGDDRLSNLEWCTRSENMIHAYKNNLRNDNKPVEVKDMKLNRVLIFGSCTEAGKVLGVTETTISNRCKSNGFKAYDGYQFRFHPCYDKWPDIDFNDGGYLVTFTDGTKKKCTCSEAARYAGVTRTSLLRLLREGRNKGNTNVLIERI